jgi:hypothetical protein
MDDVGASVDSAVNRRALIRHSVLASRFLFHNPARGSPKRFR